MTRNIEEFEDITTFCCYSRRHNGRFGGRGRPQRPRLLVDTDRILNRRHEGKSPDGPH